MELDLLIDRGIVQRDLIEEHGSVVADNEARNLAGGQGQAQVMGCIVSGSQCPGSGLWRDIRVRWQVGPVEELDRDVLTVEQADLFDLPALQGAAFGYAIRSEEHTSE